jgi:SNF2 family DNA or RNA helicase
MIKAIIIARKEGKLFKSHPDLTKFIFINEGIFILNIKPGTILKGPNWNEPVELKLVEEDGDYFHIVGSTTYSNTHIDQLISKEELNSFSIEIPQKYFTNEPWKVFLSLETIRYRFASLYDPLLAMNTSKVDPLPHQIEAVYGFVLKMPRIRFLIADDPGAGKTIMAGLILKELKLRHLVSRILIVLPGHLKDQWRRELKERFEENFVLVDRSILDAHYAENVWARERQIITSIDFAKRDEILPSIAAAHFDLIVVDEAHKMSAYRYGDKTTKTGRYRLGESLSRITTNLLFLTATPHKGDPENFRLFLDLLEPGFFANNDMVQQSIRNQDNPLFIRRVKEDLKDFEGKPLFLPRYVETIPFNLGRQSKNEAELYNELSRYVEQQYNLALNRDKKRNVTFALVILQRRLASSTYALLKSLERRKRKLEELLETSLERSQTNNFRTDIEDYEDLSEEERWQEEEIWETLSVAENREELEKEISTIDKLIQRAKEIIINEEEIKLKELKKSLSSLYERYSNPKQRKILIFTESRDTLDYLEKKVSDWGYSSNTIHGGMRLEDRVNAEKVFKNETEVLIATEAAGEGINLQFCNMMINYDIPWNPNRLEQRMGRIHRYGQTREVFIFNLVANDTREGRVLTRLFAKLDEIKNAMGNDKVFDVLGEIMTHTNLAQLLMDAAANARDIDEILKEIDIVVNEDYIKDVKESLGESLATRFIDYTRIKEMEAKAREYKLIPEYTESYFKKAFHKISGKYKTTTKGFLSIDSVPYELRKIAEKDSIKKSFGELLKKYPKITFDKDIAQKNSDAEFVTFGHPLFESVMVWIEENHLDSLLQGAVFGDPDSNLNGYIIFYEGEIKDGIGTVAGKRLFCLYVDDKEIKIVPSSIIWDLSEITENHSESVDIDSLKKKTSSLCIKMLEEYKKELTQERKRQADIKEKYGIKSLEILLVKLDGELITYYQRKETGENMDVAIRNKEERKNEYEKAKQDLAEQIVREKSLTMSSPKFRGIIKVIPLQPIPDVMQSDPEIEKIGMEAAMKYEIEQGRFPEDICKENLGYDIRSKDKNGNIRYIEVKSRAANGAVALTQNEWFKANRFKNEYYLYAVMNCSKEPKLYIINNPSEILSAEQKVEVRYLISIDQIQSKGKISN